MIFSTLFYKETRLDISRTNLFSHFIYCNCCLHAVLSFIWGEGGSDSPPRGQGLLIYEVSRSHTTTHHNQQGSSGRVISSSQRSPPDNTQHSQQTNIHASGGIRIHNFSRRAAADLSLRPLDHWDRQWCL